MKAIETVYDGVTFRSRLEARWAVFFDRLNFMAQYEPFEINYNGKSYVPDFIVQMGFENPRNQYPLLEIKPIRPNEEYIQYLLSIKDPKKSDILICVGEPTLRQPNGIWIKNQIKYVVGRGAFAENVAVNGFTCIRCPECGRYNVNHLDNENFEPSVISLSCERHHNIDTISNERAAEFAKEYRFDLARNPY